MAFADDGFRGGGEPQTETRGRGGGMGLIRHGNFSGSGLTVGAIVVAFPPMKKIFLILLASISTSMLLTGCVSTVDGHTKCAVPFRKDKKVSRYEKYTVDQVFAATKAALTDKGVLQGENTINHSYVAKVNERTVWVKVTEVGPTVTEVAVQVRTKAGGTDLNLAAEIDKLIVLHLTR
jgi:predicted small secreted protein